ncbi:type I restriction endonuclease subunit S [Klebsiella aerogenes]|uniref:restriction endonuclease subunit S n=1 Tax=Klebsiella aerogenes TaxID=548 RepID=UPI001C8CF28C|nr:restriction endonuclease subunit S [Klebsiella aerogenes]MBX9001174.1 type I restriction endonuclease subunit S [Klebsiella aerogenes]
MSAGKLPEGWATAPVSTVTTLIRGVTYKKEQALNYLQDDYLPLIRANNIQNGKFDTTDLVFVPKNLVKESQKISPEDIVIAMSSGSKSVVGKSAYQRLPFECSFGAFCGVLRPEKFISSNFIAHFTKSSFYRNKISSLSAGANINNIKPASFDLINVPIPSLAEQKIIAEKLDTLLAQVDSTKARLEQIPQILKRFRQSVLAAAFTKKLTESSKFIEKKISDVCSFQNGFAFKSSWFAKKGSYQVIKLANIRDGHLFLENAPTYVNDDKGIEFSKFLPNIGDTLISMTGTRFKKDYGFGCIITQKHRILINQRVGRLIPIKTSILPEYLSLFVRSELFREQFFKGETGGVNQGNVGSQHIQSIVINVPPLLEQAEIVRRVEQLFAYADTIEKQVNSALTRVNSLTQSILAKAFRGELTAQWRAENPDLISGENSAAALLEKIKAERAASGGKKTSRKKT